MAGLETHECTGSSLFDPTEKSPARKPYREPYRGRASITHLSRALFAPSIKAEAQALADSIRGKMGVAEPKVAQ